MKRLILPAIGISFMLSLCMCAGKDPRPGVEDFHGIQWKQAPSSGADLVFVRAEDGDQIYRKKDDSLDIGPVRAESIEYDFWKDKFYRARVKVKNDPGYYNSLANYFTKTYGIPMDAPSGQDGPDPLSDVHTWVPGKITVKVMTPKQDAPTFVVEYIHLSTSTERLADKMHFKL